MQRPKHVRWQNSVLLALVRLQPGAGGCRGPPARDGTHWGPRWDRGLTASPAHGPAGSLPRSVTSSPLAGGPGLLLLLIYDKALLSALQLFAFAFPPVPDPLLPLPRRGDVLQARASRQRHSATCAQGPPPATVRAWGPCKATASCPEERASTRAANPATEGLIQPSVAARSPARRG